MVHRGKIVFRTLGFILSTLGSVPSYVFTVVLGTLNTFDGTDPKVDRVKPKVQNTIFFSLWLVLPYTFPSIQWEKILGGYHHQYMYTGKNLWLLGKKPFGDHITIHNKPLLHVSPHPKPSACYFVLKPVKPVLPRAEGLKVQGTSTSY